MQLNCFVKRNQTKFVKNMKVKLLRSASPNIKHWYMTLIKKGKGNRMFEGLCVAPRSTQCFFLQSSIKTLSLKRGCKVKYSRERYKNYVKPVSRAVSVPISGSSKIVERLVHI